VGENQRKKQKKTKKKKEKLAEARQWYMYLPLGVRNDIAAEYLL
jgi:hypothetical protein